MEERYEIRGKIGQGGLGAVYRGYDMRMNREVAIKRITTGNEEDPALQEESTRQLIKEAGALASLQHPHIVTIYDVGFDQDGPYVVMELISGKTLDELIERAPLTWQDFRELALQTHEALIAAQELDLIHGDIKPSNLMLTWLPSGKFQVKIVDFGLATLAHSQSKEELAELETVFGSIFFMAPEQFERVPLDARTDIYAMGCVYYQSLTGIYPYDGNNGNEVMNAHLNHIVTPLQDVRSDIPVWACDWIMWLINRNAADRPASSREALQVFLQNDKIPNPKMSLGTPPPVQQRQGGAGPQGPRIPRPSTPAARPQPGQQARPGVPAVVAPTSAINQPKTKTAPQPLLPPEGSKPSVHTSPHHLAQSEPTPTAQSQSAATPEVQPRAPQPKKKKKLSKGLKTTIGVLLGVGVIAGALAVFLLGSKRSHDYNEIIAFVSKNDSAELTIERGKLEALLNATTSDSTAQEPLLYKALANAKSSDGSDIDSIISEFALKQNGLTSDARARLFRDVVGKRKNTAAVPALLDYARSTSDPALASAAILGVRSTATEAHLKPLIDVVQTTPNEEVRKAAGDTMAAMIARSTRRDPIAAQLSTAYINATSGPTRQILLTLIARCGGEQARMLIRSGLLSGERETRNAAVTAVAAWPDDSIFKMLLGQLVGATEPGLRSSALDVAILFASDPDHNRNPDAIPALLAKLGPVVRTLDEQKKYLNALAKHRTEPWARQIITGFAKDAKNDPAIIQLAQRTLNSPAPNN